MSADNTFCFESSIEVDVKSEELEALLETTKEFKNHADIKKAIDNLTRKCRLEDLNKSEDQILARDATIIFFTRISPNKNLKKYLYERLVDPRGDGEELSYFDEITKSLFKQNATFTIKKVINVRFCHHILSFFTCYLDCLESSKYGNYLKRTFPFYEFILKLFSIQFGQPQYIKNGHAERGLAQDEDCCNLLTTALTQLIDALPKAFQDDGVIFSQVNMILYSYKILRLHHQLNYSIVSKCGQVMAFYLKHLPEEERTRLKWKNAPILDLIDNPSNRNCIVLREFQIENIFCTDQMLLVLNMAIFTSVDSDFLLTVQIGERPLLEHLFVHTVTLGMKMSNYPEQIVQITQQIEVMSGILNRLPNYAQAFISALGFCFNHLDHFIEHVIVYTKKVLHVLVDQAAKYYLDGDRKYLDTIFQKLNLYSERNKIRVQALSVICSVLDFEILKSYYPGLQTQLLVLIGNGQHPEVCANMYTTLMAREISKMEEKEAFRCWICPILSMLRKEGIKYHNIYRQIASNCFRIHPSVFGSLFDVLSDVSVDEYHIVLNCLLYARKHGITVARDTEYDEGYLWRGLIPRNKLMYLMIHHDETIRIKVLQVIADCQKSTELFDSWEFTFLKKYYETNISSQTPCFRNQFVSHFKKILTRFETTYANLIKQSEENKSILAIYDGFLLYITNESLLYLNPDANQSRRKIALQLLVALQLVIKSKTFRYYLNDDKIKNLKNILNDGYESNKTLAVHLLSCLPTELLGFTSKQATFDYYKKCLQMVTDIRPSQSQSACYMFQVVLHSPYEFKQYSATSSNITKDKAALLIFALMEKMEKMSKEKPNQIADAAKTSQLYGLLYTIFVLITIRDKQVVNDVYQSIFEQLTNFCLDIKTYVMPVVCALSPEGNLPDFEDNDVNSTQSDQSSKSQMILVYAWRTIKFIMVLFAEIVKQSIEMEAISLSLTEEKLLQIGEFLVDVFKQSKHRGVFEQAHVAFSAICKAFVTSKRVKLNVFPIKCLQEAIDLCIGKKIDERLIATRRSAGLPFLSLAVLTVVTDLTQAHLKNSIIPLLALTTVLTEKNPERTMHCFNVLRFMFNNSKLTTSLAPWLDRGTIAALQGYKSSTWGIRNSATLLLSTLLLKIFGAPPMSYEDVQSNNTTTMAMFYLKYKRAMNFLLKKLDEEGKQTDSLIMYPVLLILARLYPVHCESINSKMKNYIEIVDFSIKSPSYRIRDVAARASISLMSTKVLEQRLTEIFLKLSKEDIIDVECHGLLLQARHIFQTVEFDTLLLPVYIRTTHHLLNEVGKRFSHQTVSLYMEIVFMLLAKYKVYSDKIVLKEILQRLVQRDSLSNITTSASAFSWYRFQLLSYILINKFKHVQSTYKLLTNIISQHLYSRDVETLRRCLHFLIYFNQITSREQFETHPLFESKEIEISSIIKGLVHTMHCRCRREFLYYTHSYLIRFFNVILQKNLEPLGDCTVLVFLLLRFYPCFFKVRTISAKQRIWNWFISMAINSKDEDVISAIITCLNTFVKCCTLGELKQLDFKALLLLLMKSAVPEAADYRRLATAQFIIDSGLFSKKLHVSEFHRYNVFNIIMVLLEDDESIVRNTMSMLLSTDGMEIELFIRKSNRPMYFTAYKAREYLCKSAFTDFSKEMAVCMLASWAIRHLPEPTSGASKVYERSEANLYAENIPITVTATRILSQQLWNSVPQDVANKTFSVLIEEQTLLITTVVLNSLIRFPSPMVNVNTKRTVITSLKNIYKFLEKTTVGRKDFNRKFQDYFMSDILILLQKSLDTDYSAVKAFFMLLYEPVIAIPMMNN